MCLIDEWLKDQGPLRQRGPAPKLSDFEVLTIEVVGEFLGIDTDSGLLAHFRRHHGELFPALGEVHRTTFSRQAYGYDEGLRALFYGLCAPTFWSPGPGWSSGRASRRPTPTTCCARPKRSSTARQGTAG